MCGRQEGTPCEAEDALVEHDYPSKWRWVKKDPGAAGNSKIALWRSILFLNIYRCHIFGILFYPPSYLSYIAFLAKLDKDHFLKAKRIELF